MESNRFPIVSSSADAFKHSLNGHSECSDSDEIQNNVLLHMRGYQCDKAVNKNDTRDVM